MCSEDVILTSMLKKDRIVEFLFELNPKFNQVRAQILSREKIPSFNEVYFMVRGEQHRRTTMFNDHNLQGLAMVSNKVPSLWTKSLQDRDMSSSKKNKEGLWCSYCKKQKCTRESMEKRLC